MLLWFKVFLFLLLATPSFAGLPPTRILDEGTDKGVAFKFDCVGAGIVCSQSGVTGTLTVGTGAGGDSVSVDGVAVTDPNFASTGDVDFVDTANVITGTVVSVRPAAENSIEALLDLQDLQGAVTDGQVPNTITIDNAITATALAANPADCGANTFATTIAASGALTCATPALGTDTSGNYVLDVADGTGIDGTASAEGATYTPTFDATELEALTWGAGGNASNIWTFNLSGTDPVMTFSDGSVEIERTSIGDSATPTNSDALILVNPTDASAVTPEQHSPLLVFKSEGWDTSGLQSLEHQFGIGTRVYDGAGVGLSGGFRIYSKRDNASSWTTLFSLQDTGEFEQALTMNAYGAAETLSTSRRWNAYNNKASTVSTDEFGAPYHMYGTGWKTNATAASQAMSLDFLVAPEQGTVNPIGVLKYVYGTNTTTPSLTNELYRLEWGDRLGVVFNENGADQDFRVESDTITNALAVDGATGMVTAGGDITITGDNIEATTETDRFVFMANGSTYAPEAVDLGTDTVGNYAAGDAEAGAALTGDSATAFFASGTLEVAIGGTGTTTSTGTGAVVLGTSPTFTTSITATNLITDAHLATTESINLPIYSAKLTGAFVVRTPTSGDASTQGARIDAGDGNWRLLFDATTDEAAVWQFRLPDYWAAHGEVNIAYTMTSATTLEVEFEVDVMCVSDGDAADVGTASFAGVAVGSATVPGTVGYPDEISVTVTDDSCAAGDMMWVYLSTDADDATADDATGDREVIGVEYEFTR